MIQPEVRPLHQLIYISSAVGDISREALASILASSRRNNQAASVTGLLLFHDGCFFQVLEGDEADVRRILVAIRRDPRHTGTIILADRPSEQRAFSSWSMGFVGSDKLDDDQRETLIDLANLLDAETRPGFTPSPTVSTQIDTFLGSFREFAAS